MINITLKQLRYFASLARHRHFGRAADDCSISQPALSMQIKELEQTLGAPLIEKSARPLRLTSFGEKIMRNSNDILRAVKNLEELAQASRDNPIGTLRIGVIPTVAPYLLPTMMGNLTRNFPELEITFKETVTANLIKDILEGRLDTAIVALPVSEPSLTELALFTEEFVLVRPRKDADKPVPKPEMLREMRLLLLEEGHCFRDQALSYCKPSSTATNDFMHGSSLSTLVQMVSAGIGVTLIPEMALAVEQKSASVSITPFEDPRPNRTIGMIWRKKNPLKDHFEQISKSIQKPNRTLDPT